MLRDLPGFSVPFPEKEIFVRLGGNVHLTVLPDDVRSGFITLAHQAFSHCTPCGRYGVISVAEITEDGLLLESGDRLRSRDFAAGCKGCVALWCGAVTVGREITEFQKSQASLSSQALCDAVGSESADAAMDFLHNLARQELRRGGLALSDKRFSPGYGDMALNTQVLVNRLLNLESLGITLSDEFYMIPEKSVTAFAPLFSN